MNARQRKVLLEKAKSFFVETLAPNHIRNTEKLVDLNAFRVNPFLVNYLAGFLEGNRSPEALAKVLLYPRILGTSINTSFGSNLQAFCSAISSASGSSATGMDLEFIDAIDGRKKYCQLKAGPDTINNDDVETISRHFQRVRALARQNRLPLQVDDLVVGVMYGTPDELNANYRVLAREYPVYVGRDFWHRLTGDPDFYGKLIAAIFEATKDLHAKEVVDGVVKKLAAEIRKNPDFFR